MKRLDPYDQKLDRLQKIADRALHLLKEEDNPELAMRWAEDHLREANLYNFPPHTNDPEKWADQVIAQNPDMVDQSLPWIQERDSHPERAETFESLIFNLIPTEGGL